MTGDQSQPAAMLIPGGAHDMALAETGFKMFFFSCVCVSSW